MKKLAKIWTVVALAAPLLLSGCAASDASTTAATQGAAVVAPVATPSTFTSRAADTVFIPDFEGLPASEITPVLSKLGLKAKWDGGVKGSDDWVVSDTEPKMGKEVQPGTTVTLHMEKASASEDAVASNDPTSDPSSATVPSSATIPSTSTASSSTTGATTGSGISATDVSYANCDAVKAAGKAPIRTGQPGYEPKLDRDGDGIGCEV